MANDKVRGRDPYLDIPEVDDPELLQDALRAERAENRRLQAQLVALDAALEGKFVTVADVAPAQFELRRKHACHVPQEIIERAFGPDENVLGVHLMLRTHYVSGRVMGFSHNHVELAANARRQPDPTAPGNVEGTSSWLSWATTTIPRSGFLGLPRGWRWLVTSWRLRYEYPPQVPLDGVVRFSYNDRAVAQRHLLDTRDQDLLFVMSEHIQYNIVIEMASALTITPPGRVYVEWDVIERRPAVSV